MNTLSACSNFYSSKKQIETFGVAWVSFIFVGIKWPLANWEMSNKNKIRVPFFLSILTQMTFVLRFQIWLANTTKTKFFFQNLLGFTQFHFRNFCGHNWDIDFKFYKVIGTPL